MGTQSNHLDIPRARLFTRVFRSRVLSARWIPTIFCGEGHEFIVLHSNDLHTDKLRATIWLGFLQNSLGSNESGLKLRAGLNRNFIFASKGDTLPLLEGTYNTNLQARQASSAYHGRKLSTTNVNEAQQGGYGTEIRLYAEEGLRGDEASRAWEVRLCGDLTHLKIHFLPKTLDNTPSWAESTVITFQLQTQYLTILGRDPVCRERGWAGDRQTRRSLRCFLSY